ncbi:MAG: hypothetical protein ACJ8C4_10510 [Gemmataceae bacterium]
MANSEDEVPEGAAFFPSIDAELGVHPLLLAVLHSVVFLGGSAEEIVNPTAADEALGAIAGYVERCDGKERQRILEDLSVLRGYAREQGWPKQLTAFLKSFPVDFGLADEE